MKSDSILIFISFLLTFVLISASKPNQERKGVYVEKAIGKINQQFQQDLQELLIYANAFETSVRSFQTTGSNFGNLWADYQNLRSEFKRIEFLLEYLDKEAFDKTMNGAPLPKLEKKVADLNVLEPKGLQVIDELVGELKTDISVYAELVEHSQKFRKDVQKIHSYFKIRRITDRQFLEASRQSVVRLITLGITGFDTPGTASGIRDSKSVLESIDSYFQFYASELENVNRSEFSSELNSICQNGIIMAEESTFENFDRMRFIKEVGHPIYKLIKDIHLSLDYETIDEVSKYPLAINFESNSLFEEDFFNPFYYISVPNDPSFDEVTELGKMLFYDPVLSSNNEMSCANCHKPEKAFTDGLKTSFANDGSALKRNAMTLNYSGFATGFFHDLRTRRLEDQFEHVVLNKDEFNSSYQEIIGKLERSESYRQLFNDAFPAQKGKIRSNQIDYALAAYVMKLSPFDNVVDTYFQGATDEIPKEIKNGFNLFTGKANCATCHFLPLYSGLVPPLFNESEAEVLGVPEDQEKPWSLDPDLGRLGNGKTQEVATFYRAAFKTPTIRNIDLTGPYMHNGVFKTLEEVMDFYNEGGGAGQGIELEHQTLAPDKLNLTQKEIQDIITFMKSLNDNTLFKAVLELPRDFEKNEIDNRVLLK